MSRQLSASQLVERSITKKYRKQIWNPFIGAVKRYQLISEAKHVFPGISLVVSHAPVDRAVAAQAVDELINISDVRAAGDPGDDF